MVHEIRQNYEQYTKNSDENDETVGKSDIRSEN